MTPRVILLDRGHGGEDPGAVWNGIREADLNTAVTRELYRLLEADPAYQPALTCPLDLRGRCTLEQRTRVANAMAPDLMISNHFNAGGGSGFEVYPEVPREAAHPRFSLHQASLSFARLLAQEMDGLLPLRGAGGIQYRSWNGDAYYGIIRMADYPTVLVENAFVDHPGDMAAIHTPQGLADLARRQYRTVCRHFGTRPTADPTPEDGSPDGEAMELCWRVLVPAAVFDTPEAALAYLQAEAPEDALVFAAKK